MATQIRIFVCPMERYNNGKVRALKYFQSRNNPGGIPRPPNFTPIDYGEIDVAIVGAELEDTVIATLQAQSDIQFIPANLDLNPNTNAVNAVVTFLEGLNIPANWVDTSYTYRGILKITLGFFQYMQRLTSINGGRDPFSADNVSLGDTYGSLSPQWQGWITQAALELELVTQAQLDAVDLSTWTIRRILKWMGDQWGDRPVFFGNFLEI